MITQKDNPIGVCGFVRSYYSQQPIGGAEIFISPINLDGSTIPVVPVNVTSGDDGFYQTDSPLQNGLYKMTASKGNYDTINYAVCIDGKNVIQDILFVHTDKKGKIEADREKEQKVKKLLFCEIFDSAE